MTLTSFLRVSRSEEKVAIKKKCSRTLRGMLRQNQFQARPPPPRPKAATAAAAAVIASPGDVPPPSSSPAIPKRREGAFDVVDVNFEMDADARRRSRIMTAARAAVPISISSPSQTAANVQQQQQQRALVPSTTRTTVAAAETRTEAVSDLSVHATLHAMTARNTDSAAPPVMSVVSALDGIAVSELNLSSDEFAKVAEEFNRRHEPLPPWVSTNIMDNDQITMLWAIACREPFMVTGEGGCGKTRAIDMLIKMATSGQLSLITMLIRRQFPLDGLIGGWGAVHLVSEYLFSAAELERSVIVLAQGGVAASMYPGRGQTIHQALGLRGESIGDTESAKRSQEQDIEQLILSARVLRTRMAAVAKTPTQYDAKLEYLLSHTKAGRLLTAEILVCDEYGMLDLDLAILLESTLRKVRGDERFMGGCTPLFVGDPGQLPSVGTAKTPIYIHWCAQFRSKANWLTNHRQSGDPFFAGILRKLRVGASLDETEQNALIERIDDPQGGKPLYQAAYNRARSWKRRPPMQLFATNEAVDAANSMKVATSRYFPGRLFTMDYAFSIEVSAFGGTYYTYLSDSRQRLGNVPDVTHSRLARNTYTLCLSREDGKKIEKACMSLLNYSRMKRDFSKAMFREGMPVRIVRNVDVPGGLANGTPALLHYMLGDLGIASQTFSGDVCDLRRIESQSGLSISLARMRFVGKINRKDGNSDCFVHDTGVMKAYDEMLKLRNEIRSTLESIHDFPAALLGTILSFVTDTPQELRFASSLDTGACSCSGLLITASPDDRPRTTVLPFQIRTQSVSLSKGQARIVMEYCPVVPDCARTIHASQGKTYSEVSVSLKGCLRPYGKYGSRSEECNGLAYTGLSRCPTLKGLSFVYGHVNSEMLRAGSPDFINMFYRSPEMVKFCTMKHPLLKRLTDNTTRTRWININNTADTLAVEFTTQPKVDESAPLLRFYSGRKRLLKTPSLTPIKFPNELPLERGADEKKQEDEGNVCPSPAPKRMKAADGAPRQVLESLPVPISAAAVAKWNLLRPLSSAEKKKRIDAQKREDDRVMAIGGSVPLPDLCDHEISMSLCAGNAFDDDF